VLSPIADKTISSGQSLTFTNVVNDPDLPPNVLTFTLVGGPTGASLDSASGVFSWLPDNSQAPSTNNMSVIVADNGTPSLSATQSFKVFVTVGGPQITGIHLIDSTHLSMAWSSVSGHVYHLQGCDNLTNLPGCWQTIVGSQVTASGSTTQSNPIAISGNQRFYRVVEGPEN
jgi:putative Ig domain-containing protein